MVKFSIIVPVYNVEKYLENCVESILSQTFSGYEILLINDGSTDQSRNICDRYKQNNKQIKVFHKLNGGLSDARNLGIENSKGQYIVFIDSDDYIELNTLDNFNKELEKSDNPDVLISKIKKIYKDSPTRYMDKDIPINIIRKGNKSDIVNWIFNKSDNTWPAVRYVVKSDLIKKHNLRFVSEYLHEDIDWTSQLFLYSSTFTCSDYYWYNHRMGRKGSITTNKSSKRTLDVIELVAKNINDDKYKDIEVNLRDVIFKRLVKSVFSSLSDYKYYNKLEKRIIIKSLYHNQSIFNYTSLFSHKIFVGFCRIFGFKVGLFIVGIVHRI